MSASPSSYEITRHGAWFRDENDRYRPASNPWNVVLGYGWRLLYADAAPGAWNVAATPEAALSAALGALRETHGAEFVYS